MELSDLVRLSSLSEEDEGRFPELREQALLEARITYNDRAASYNVDHGPFREMPFGIVSLVSELFKRIIRLTSLVTPRRREELREEDLSRILDTMIDSINYASWGFAMTQIAIEKLEEEAQDARSEPE